MALFADSVSSMKSVKSNIFKYYLTSVFSGLSFTLPITILYFRSFGLPFLEISLLQSIYMASTLVFKVPTGALADEYGRKKMMILGAAMLPIGTLVTAFTSSFFVFSLVYVFFGLSAALMMDAEAALIYDSLKQTDQENRYIDVNGKALALFSLLAAIASPIGSYLFILNRRMPFYFDTVTTFLAFIVFLTMVEPKRYLPPSEKHYLILLRDGAKQIIENKWALWLVLFGTLLAVCSLVFNVSINQPFLISQGISVKGLGYMFSGIALVQAFASYFSDKVEKSLHQNSALLIIFLVPALAYLVMRTPIVFFVVVAYFFYVLVGGFSGPILGGYLQRRLESSTRATALSVQSFFANGVGILVLPLFGLLADKISAINTVVVLGLLLLIGGFGLYLKRPK